MKRLAKAPKAAGRMTINRISTPGSSGVNRAGPAAGQLSAAVLLAAARQPQTLPANVVYTVNGGLMPDIPPSPDMLPQCPIDWHTPAQHIRRVYGLSPRADAMARFVAHGVTLSDSYRAAYRANALPLTISRRANSIATSDRFKASVHWYSSALDRIATQRTVNMVDYVKSRLVLESQHADVSGSRIRALELLGKTESMFIDVKRTERVLDATQVASLKVQLEQRLRTVLARLGSGPSRDPGTEADHEGGIESLDSGPHAVLSPLSTHEGPPNRIYANPLKHTPDYPPPGLPSGKHPPVGSPSEIEAGDEFSGPLVLGGGLSGQKPHG